MLKVQAEVRRIFYDPEEPAGKVWYYRLEVVPASIQSGWRLWINHKPYRVMNIDYDVQPENDMLGVTLVPAAVSSDRWDVQHVELLNDGWQYRPNNNTLPHSFVEAVQSGKIQLPEEYE